MNTTGEIRMEITEILSQLNSRVLEQMKNENGWDEDSPDGISRNLMGKIPQMWNRLQPEEKKVLVYFLFRMPGEPVPYRQFENFARSYAPYGIYKGLTGLRRKGIVYTLRRLWGEMAFYIPCELQISWRKYIRQVSFPSVTPPILLLAGEEREGLCDILFSLLQVHRHQPIILTKKGELPSRMRRVWEDKIPYDPSLFASSFPEERGGITGWFMNFLEKFGLMARVEKKKENQLKVHEPRCQGLFTGDKGHVQQKLYMHIKKEFVKQVPFFTVIFEAMEDQQDDCFSYGLLQKNWTKLFMEYGLDAPEKEWADFTERVLPFLYMVGFLEGQQIENGDWTLKWGCSSHVEKADTQKAGYIQPTFEVLLFPFAPYEVRWEIGEFSRLAEKQGMWIFQLEKEVASYVQDANAFGRLTRCLSAVQEGVIPENVLKQMQKWLNPVQKVVLSNVTLLRCPDKPLADRLEGAKLAGIRERLNEKVFLVEEGYLPSLERELKRMAISLHLPDDEVEFEKPIKVEEPQFSIHVESVFPEMRDVMPQLKELPSLWYKNKQKYHPSTLRMFVEKARSIGVPVQMEAGKKEWEDIYICRFVQEKGLDMVYFKEGNKEHRIPLLDIGRIQMKI